MVAGVWEKKTALGSHFQLPLPAPAEPAPVPRGWGGPRGCVSTLLLDSGTLVFLGEGRAESNADAARKALGPGSPRVSGQRGPGGVA